METLQAADIKVITKYGKTGGIAGPLNTLTDKVNGVDICPNNPTVGCDFANNSSWNDNGTPNDGGDDMHTGDLIVRTNDSFELIAAWAWNGVIGAGEDTITLKTTLPNGYILDNLPGSCDATLSSINGQDIVCVRKDVDKDNVGTVAEDLTFSVRVLGSTVSGAQPGDISFEISGKNATIQTDNAGVSLTVTAAPRWNLQKAIHSMRAGYIHNGVNGYRIYYKYYIEVDEVNGETDNATGYLGVESMGDNATFTFTDDLSGVSPNAELIECRADTFSNSGDPYPYFNINYPERSIATPKGAQAIACSQTGSNINVNLSHVDATLNHIPTRTIAGGNLPVNRAIAAIGTIEVFVPLDDVKKGEDNILGTPDDGELQTINKLINFDPTAPSGNSNFGINSESEKDNSYTYTLYAARGSFSKGYTTKHGLLEYNEGGSSGWRTGDGLLTANAEFASRLVYTNTGGIDLTGVQICDVIDANRIEIIDVVNKVRSHSSGPFDYFATGGFNADDLEFEYASTYEDDSWLASNGGDLTLSYGAKVATECSAVGVWHSTPEAAKATGLGTITKVRIKVKNGVAVKPGERLWIWLKHKVRATTLNGTPLQNGDEIVNYGSTISNEYSTTWSKPSYIPNEYPTPVSNWNGDRVTFSGGKVRIIKTINKNSFELGNIAIFTLDSSYTNDTGTAETTTVTIKDMLPYGLKYIPLSTQNASEPTIGTCADVVDLGIACTVSNQVLIWNLGVKTANVEIPDIIYQAQIEATAPQGTMTNYVIIEAPSDSSDITQRRSDVNLNITIPSTINISKTVLNTQPQETNGAPIEYSINARNGSAVTITALDIIDILPFNGDGVNGAIKFRDLNLQRSPGTSYNGTRKFERVELIAHPQSPALCDLTPGVKYYYTDQPSTNVNISPKDTSNTLGAGTIWCEGTINGPAVTCGFTNTQVTAIRATGPSMANDAICQMKINMSVAGNMPDDFYNNSAGASAIGVTLPVLSNSATTVIVKSSVGNYIWLDSNANGIQDPTEIGINDVNVSLYKSDNTLVESIKTGNDINGDAGYYYFTNLHSGDYYIQVTPPTEYAISTKDIGDDTKDSDIDQNTGKTDIFTLGVASEDLKYDAGVFKLSSIGDTIWYDSDRDGILDVGEDCRGVDLNVTLLDVNDVEISNQTTNNCQYLFNNLLPNSYKVRFALPLGYKATIKDTGNDDTKDSDFDTTTLTSDLIIVANGEDILNVDFGYFTNTSIGNLVWVDANANGIQDVGEIGLDGVKVELFNDTNILQETKTTSNGGLYLFENLTTGNYKVKFTLPEGYKLSTNDTGNDDTKDSDVDANLITTNITLISGQTDITWDMGVYQDASLGNKVWIDTNGNGVQDTNEDCNNLIIKVDLLDTNDIFLVTQNTQNCNYKFENLTPGIYKVRFTFPDGYDATNRDSGNDDTKDSDIDTVSKTTSNYILQSGDDEITADAGMLEDGSLGNRVWFDSNKNGMQDDEEIGIKDVIIKLLLNDVEVNRTTTDDNGMYLFTNLRPNTYKVQMTLPEGYFLSPKNSGNDDEKDSDINVDTLTTDDVILVSGSSNLSVDMGIYTIAKISGYVKLDNNGDKQPDKPIENVKIELNSCTSNNIHLTTYTDVQGFYEFVGLIPGCYRITEIDPSGYTSVLDVDGENDNNITVSLAMTDITERNFIDEPILKLSGHVRADMDFDDDIEVDAIKSTDINLKDVEITLYKNNTQIDSVKTDKNGFYQFTNITPGVYTIKEKDPKGFDSLRDIDGGDKNSILVTIIETDIVDRDFDDQKTILVSGTIRVDIDGDRKVDEPLKNTQLLLCKVSTPCSVDENIATTYTDENGRYQFVGLKPGNYNIVEIDMPGFESLKDIDGGDKNIININLDGLNDVLGQDFEDLAIAPIYIKINKTVAKKQASIGDFVPYSITVENINESYNYAAVRIKDLLPAGFKYVKESAKIMQGNQKIKLNTDGSSTVNFGVFSLKAKEIVTISYLLKVGVAVSKGEHINSAIAIQNGGKEVSNVSAVSVTIIANPFIDNSLVVGKVFEDNNANGIQDKGENGIPGVRLATVDGIIIETDGYGRYHVADVKSGGFGGRGSNFIIKVDPATLPKDANFTTENPHVYRVTSGQLNVIDFGVKLPKVQRLSKDKIITKEELKEKFIEVEKQISVGSIYFDSDQDCIRPDQIKVINNIVQKIKEYKHGSIIIDGNTDARAPIWYNKKLAYKRAKSVYNELKQQLGDELMDKVDIIYDNCETEVKFNPKYDWWGKPNIPRTKKECTQFGLNKEDCSTILNSKKGGAL